MSTNRNNRAYIFGIAMIFLIAVAFVSNARSGKPARYTLSAAQHLTMVIDSIDYRSDLTRVYGKFIGTPHTSQRLNSIQLQVNGATYMATDIDGVDFERWFQWEDDGVIPVEIDFNKMPRIDKGRLILVTGRGTDTCTIQKL